MRRRQFLESVAAAAAFSAGKKLQPLAFGQTRSKGGAIKSALEDRFMTSLDAERARAEHKVLTAEPHIAGSIADHRNANYVLEQFHKAGLQAEIEPFQAVISRPVEARFDLLAPVQFSGPSPEYVAEDPVSNNPANPPIFNAYSGSGDVTSQVIYVNYGLAADYRNLQSQGIRVAGRIVIARYGRSYRGVKAMLAEQHQAAGLILYSDPLDDGYRRGDVYPKGPWRPPSSVQRGSVLYEFIKPGSVEADGSNVPHLPVLPISYSDAKPILQSLGGTVAPPEWQGGLPFAYHIGPGPAVVRMRVQMTSARLTLWNVIAKVPGSSSPDAIVLVGNHRDAWAYGGVDPNSGTTSMLELAHGLGDLLRGGWRPRRSIWLCSWDGEEMGEFGSVTWAKVHEEVLSRDAVAYLNVDYSVAGNRFAPAATPSLKRLILESAATVPDPEGGTVLERATRQLCPVPQGNDQPASSVAQEPEPHPAKEQLFRPEDLGGGSDYIAFFDRLGIPSADLKFDGPYGVYHSIFDDHRWVENFADPTFAYHIAAARIIGVMALRLSDAEVLPLDYETYGREVLTGIEQIRRGLTSLGEAHQADFEPARRAAAGFISAAQDLNRRVRQRLAGGLPAQPGLNRNLVRVEQAFLLPAGLPGRPWYRNAVFAPDIESGYNPAVLPGVQEAADSKDFERMRLQLDALIVSLQRAASLLSSS